MRTAFLLLWIGALAAITVGSLWPQPPDAVGGSDKLMHVAAYTLLSALTWPAFALWRGGIVLIAAFGLIIFGIAIEVVQPLVGREQSIADAVANAAGVVLGLTFAQVARRVAVRPG